MFERKPKPKLIVSLDRSFSETLESEMKNKSLPSPRIGVDCVSERDFVFMVAALVESFYDDETAEDMKDGVACIKDVAEWIRNVRKGGEGE